MATKYITLTNLETFLGQLKENYKATDDTLGGIKTGYDTDTTNKYYGIQLDTGGNAYVHVPWENSAEYTLPTASSSTKGGIKIGYNNGNNSIGSVAINAALILDNEKAYVSLPSATETLAGLISADDKAKLNSIASGANNYTLPEATNTTLGGVKIGSNIAVSGGTISIGSSQIDSILNELGIWGDNSKGITYSDLKKLIDNNNLSPGTKYRITDYQTLVNSNSSTDYKSADKKFDIIVEAISTNKLSENAKACKRSTSSSDYFYNCNLDAWELKYCFTNDDGRFEWANPNGKGVIYYMKDEWGNEAPYDFKNIKIALDSTTYVTPPTSDKYFFTFSKVTDVRTSSPKTISDASLDGTAKFNIIKQSNMHISGSSEKYGNHLLNKIICIYDESSYYNQSGEKIIGNYFDYNCYNITLLGSPQYNKFDTDCHSIVIGGPKSINNIFGKNCESVYLSKIIFGSGYIKKTEDGVDDQISYNKFGDNCSDITSTINFHNNIFGNNCKYFKVSTNFMSNRIYDNCIGWEFGNYCMKNIIESNNYVGGYWGVDDLINYSPIYQGGVYNNNYAKLQVYITNGTGGGTYTIADWVCNCVFGKNSHADIKFSYENDGYFAPGELTFDNMIKNLYFHDLIDNAVNTDGDYDYTSTITLTGSTFKSNYLNSHNIIHVTYDQNDSKYGFYTPRYL